MTRLVHCTRIIFNSVYRVSPSCYTGYSSDLLLAMSVIFTFTYTHTHIYIYIYIYIYILPVLQVVARFGVANQKIRTLG